jgi:PAS domain S-box-containing protein
VSGYIAVADREQQALPEQRAHTEELALLKEFNESIVESVNVGLLAVNEDGRIIRCNSTFEKMLDLSREQAIGKQVEEVFDDAFAANLNNILGKSRWHLTEIRNAYKLHTSDSKGRSLILNVAVAPLRSVSNEQTGAIIVLENVFVAGQTRGNASAERKAFKHRPSGGGVAHEVNTPLTGVSSYTQMLLGMIPETDPEACLAAKDAAPNRPCVQYRREPAQFLTHGQRHRTVRDRDKQAARRHAPIARTAAAKIKYSGG